MAIDSRVPSWQDVQDGLLHGRKLSRMFKELRFSCAITFKRLSEECGVSEDALIKMNRAPGTGFTPKMNQY